MHLYVIVKSGTAPAIAWDISDYFFLRATDKPTTYKPLPSAVLRPEITLKQTLGVKWEKVFVPSLHNELSHSEWRCWMCEK